MDDDLARVIQDAIEQRALDTDLPRPPRRTPDTNNPFQASVTRGIHNRAHRDPVGQKAVGNIDKQRKKGRKP